MRINEFFVQPGVDEIFGSRENRKKFYDVLKFDVNKELGNIRENTNEAEKVLASVGEIIKKAASIRALASPFQAIKQRVVMVNTMARLGDKSKYLLNTPVDAPIYKEFSIGQRGTRLGGIDAGDAVSLQSKSAAARTIYDKLGDFRLGMEKNVWEPLASQLVKGDVWSAKKSWGAFFRKFMKEQYGEDVDISTAHEKLEDPRIQEAASYAEQMVGETQIASSAGEGSNFLYSGGSAGKRLALGIFLPFSNFAFNLKSRLWNIMKYGTTGTKAEKKEAASALVGLTAEVMTYYYIAQGLKAATISLVDDSVLRALFDLEKPEDDEEEREAKESQSMASTVARDLWPLALQQDLTNEQLKWVNGIVAEDLKEEGYTDEEIERRVPFSVNPTTGDKFGIYALPFKDLDVESVDYENNTLTTKNQFGTSSTIDIDENLENYLIFASIINYFASVGIGISDFTNAVNRVKKSQIKQAKEDGRK
jgi:uncharacterized protein (DUF2164 family)